MDNQQERNASFDLGWLVGAIDGEGCVGITIRNRRTERAKPTFKPHVQISNCDKSFIDRCDRILSDLNIPHYVVRYAGKNQRRQSWQITIAGLRRVMKILPVITEHLCSEKREKAEKVMQFCISRLGVSKFNDYTDEETDLFEEIASLNLKGRSASIPNDYTHGADIYAAKI